MNKPTIPFQWKRFLLSPFPRPKNDRTNVGRLFLLSLGCSLFILIFNPFNIKSQEEWYINLLVFSLGLLFFVAVYLVEFLLPRLTPSLFQKWNLGKAILWYGFVLFFVGSTMFFYKSFLGGFRDFTLLECLFVIGRVLGIGMTVSFFVLGIYSYFGRKQFSLLSSNEKYRITSPDAKAIELNLNEILYVVSDDNYVDIHLEVDGIRKKEIFRSSLKNIEAQIVNPVSPIFRCHRQYLINFQHFKMHSTNSRKTLIALKRYEGEIPVSKKYASQINELLQTRP